MDIETAHAESSKNRRFTRKQEPSAGGLLALEQIRLQVGKLRVSTRLGRHATCVLIGLTES